MGGRAKNSCAKMTLVTGGSRSGKSSFAQLRAEELALRNNVEPVYFATAEALDKEMTERIELHKAGRGNAWQTVEVPIDPARELALVKSNSVVLLDCLTLWVSNLMGLGLTDIDIIKRTETFFTACVTCVADGTSIFLVTNEVGSGIVPENRIARRFRDLAGEVNAAAAASADEAYLIVVGLPLKLK